MERYIQDLADSITSHLLSLVYGERFDSLDDITTDEEIDNDWEYFNEKFYNELWKRYYKEVEDDEEKDLQSLVSDNLSKRGLIEGEDYDIDCAMAFVNERIGGRHSLDDILDEFEDLPNY